MKRFYWLLPLMLLSFLNPSFGGVKFKYVDVPSRVEKGYVWESQIPEGCPFPQSKLFNRIYFTGEFSDYLCGDTFYPTWAENGNLYSPWTDGRTDGLMGRSYRGNGTLADTGHAVMIGDDPMDLDISNTSPPKIAPATPYEGRYPAGSLIHNGIWYYGTYCLASSVEGMNANPTHNGFKFNWPSLGPIPGFQISYDYGLTWVASPLTPSKPLFPEPKTMYGTVKMGAPHFVDFGKNMEHSPDGKAYLVAMGAEDNDPLPRPCIHPSTTDPRGYVEADSCPDHNFKHANLSWITADQIYLARVTPSPRTINDENAYEYFAGHNQKGKAIWSRDFEDINPLIEWNNNMGCVTITYVPELKKYIMCVTDGWPTVAKMSSYFLESDELTGPWSIITYMKDFGEQSYFLNFPSKFIESTGKDMWLCHSANFAPGWNGNKIEFKPVGGRYGLALHKVRFLAEGEKVPEQRVAANSDIFKGNIAKKAVATASSEQEGFPAKNAIDGKLSPNSEWGCQPAKEAETMDKYNYTDEWIKLTWKKSQKINRVMLFDRHKMSERVCEGTLIFSDGSFITVDKQLPTTVHQGLEISFDEKEVEWVVFVIKGHGHDSKNPGISEFAVFPAK